MHSSFMFEGPIIDRPSSPFSSPSQPPVNATSTTTSQSIEQRKAFLRSRVNQITQLKALYIEQIKDLMEKKNEIIVKQPVKEEVNPKTENPDKTDSLLLFPVMPQYPESFPLVTMPPEPMNEPYIKLSIRDQINFNAYLLRELQVLVKFIITNVGVSSQETFDQMRAHYQHNTIMVSIFDKLIMKYYSVKKCREDIVRYVLRKAFKVMKTNIKKEEKVPAKKAGLLLCQRYLSKHYSQMQKKGIDVDDSDQVLEVLMPYKKNSKNKTMNANFIEEIFASPDFCQEYKKFLSGLHEIIMEDNEKKIDKLVAFLTECVKKDCLSKFNSFNRLPWLAGWMTETENVAASLLTEKYQGYEDSMMK